MYQFQAGRHHHVPTATSTGRQEERGRENGEVTGEDTEVQEVASTVRSKNGGGGDVERRCRAAMWSGDVVLSSPQMFLPSGSYHLVHLHSVVLRSPPVRSPPAAGSLSAAYGVGFRWG
jgi:hypothetical protein